MTQKPYSSVDIYCVFVFFDQKAEDLFKVRYESYFSEILTININSQYFQESFFEFSGYKFGYDLIMNNYIHRNKKIVFINDTFINGHLSYTAKTMLKNVIRILKQNDDKCLAGICKKNLLVSSKFYVSTWCFGVCINDKDKQNFDIFCGFRDTNELLRSNLLDQNGFREKVMDWLNPSSILRGWHNAPYFEKLNANQCDRKFVTIFLENYLPIYNKLFLGYPLSVGMTKNFIHDVNCKFALLLDRFYINLNKLFKRLRKLKKLK